METADLVKIISGIAGGLLTLFAAYFPGVSKRFEELPKDQKGLYMLLLIFLVTSGVFLYPWFVSGENFAAYFDRESVGTFLTALFAALAANQGLYLTVIRPRQS